MVSAGITPMDRMVYGGHGDPWIEALNNMIAPTILENRPEVAFSATELQDRITQSATSVDIRNQTVGGQSPLTRRAPWLR